MNWRIGKVDMGRSEKEGSRKRGRGASHGVSPEWR